MPPDPNGDALTYTIGSPPKNGNATITATGGFTYTPTPEARHAASGTPKDDFDQFTVTIHDGRGGSKVVTVKNLPVAPTNDAPVDGRFSVTQVNTTTGVVKGTVAATDPESDTLTYKGTTTTAKGKVTVAGNGSFTYTPTAAARHAAAAENADPTALTDSFTVTASDGHGGTLDVGVDVTITPGNKAPSNGKATVGKPDSTTGVVTGTVTAVDGDNDTLTYSGPASTAKGDIVVNSTGSFTYTPTKAARHNAASGGAAAKDTFTVTVDDGHGGTRDVAVNVAISPNRAPVQQNTNVGQPNLVTGVVTGSVTATDPDRGDTVTYRGTADTEKGHVDVATNGTFTYTPTDEARAAARGSQVPVTDTFTIAASDGRGGELGINVNVVVAPSLNNAPTAIALPTAGNPDAGGIVTGLVNVTDPDDDPLSYNLVSGPTYGDVTFDHTTGAYTYTPRIEDRAAATLTSDVETDRFVVTVTDGFSTPVTVTVNDVPLAELPASTVIATTEVGNEPFGIAISPDGERAYVTNVGDDTLSVIDTETNNVIATVNVGDSPASVAVHPTLGSVYVANEGDDTVTVIGSNNAVITTIDVGDGPYGIAVSTDGSRVYTTNNGNTITVISTATNQVTGTIPIDPVGVAFHPDPDVHLAYAINQNDDHISVINTDSGEVTDVITAGDAPFGIAIAPDGHYAYVTNVGADTVTVIDLTDNNAIVTHIDVGDEPHGIAVSQDGTRVYTANTASDSISVIETGAWRVLDTFGVGDEPSGVVLDPDGTKAYITLSADNTVTTLFIAGNEAPLAVADPTAGAPDEDGVVTGRVNVFDPDGDALTYAVTTQPIYGSVTFNEDDGTYTYTPGFEDRLTVSKTVAVETDSFTVRVSDGVNDPVDVTVPVGAVAELSRNTVVDTVGTGNFPLSVALSPNGSRAYVLERRRRHCDGHRHRDEHRDRNDSRRKLHLRRRGEPTRRQGVRDQHRRPDHIGDRCRVEYRADDDSLRRLPVCGRGQRQRITALCHEP